MNFSIVIIDNKISFLLPFWFFPTVSELRTYIFNKRSTQCENCFIQAKSKVLSIEEIQNGVYKLRWTLTITDTPKRQFPMCHYTEYIGPIGANVGSHVIEMLFCFGNIFRVSDRLSNCNDLVYLKFENFGNSNYSNLVTSLFLNGFDGEPKNC